jgi:hypothetical protein
MELRSNVIPIYGCGAGEAQAVGRQLRTLYTRARHLQSPPECSKLQRLIFTGAML